MRALILALIALLVGSGVITDLSMGEAKPRTTVVVDYTSSAWDGVVEETVADFASHMPLRYERGTGACPKMRKKIRRAIIVCSRPDLGYLGMSSWQRNQIWLNDDAAAGDDGLSRYRIACHELMHILAHVPDNYGAMPDGSCVWGYLDDPSAWDIARVAEHQARLKKRHRR